MGKNVTFLIGNGFDLKVGLKTRYTDFYQIYTQENKDDNTIIKKFKKEILKSETDGWKNWVDFELGMGQQSKLFVGEKPADDFITCFNDFVVSFNKYLTNECEAINWDAVDANICNKFISSVTQFYVYTKSVLSNNIRGLIHHSIIGEESKLNFIQFNYTNAFDELIKKSNLSPSLFAMQNDSSGNSLNKLGLNLHVHGEINGGHPTIGVNDESQITNETIRNDPRIGQIFIKPKFLDTLQNNNVNQNIPRTDALKAINESTIICTFGVSIGASDKYWWEKIGKWLMNSGGVLIIFDICGGKDDGISPSAFLNRTMSMVTLKREITNRFTHLANINSEWINKNPNKIIVELDSDMFSFKLPKNENSNEKDLTIRQIAI